MERKYYAVHAMCDITGRSAAEIDKAILEALAGHDCERSDEPECGMEVFGRTTVDTVEEAYRWLWSDTGEDPQT